MSRLTGTVVAALGVVLALPVVAAAAQAAVPFLLGILLFLFIARLAWPSPRNRR